MSRIRKHFRKAFLAGLVAAVPVAVAGIAIWGLERKSSGLTMLLFGRHIPFLGIGIAILGIYFLGLILTSLIGQVFIHWIDRLLSRMPGLKQLYARWKQVALTHVQDDSAVSHVVLIPSDAGQTLAFTTGKSIPGDEDTICVFVPNTPNPMQGVLQFVRKENMQITALSTVDAFKVILSKGKYLPVEIGESSKEPRQRCGHPVSE